VRATRINAHFAPELEEAQMSNGNVLNFSEGMRRRDTTRLLVAAKLLFPAVKNVVNRLREMGLSDTDIGGFFKFLGSEFCANLVDEGEEPKRSA
jgi:hypothetical protein